MLYYLVKLVLSAGIIVAVSEVAKVNTGLGALIKSLPLISIIAMIWLYVDTARYRQDRRAVGGHVLAGAADAADVPGAARIAEKRNRFLPEPRHAANRTQCAATARLKTLCIMFHCRSLHRRDCPSFERD